MNKFIFLLLFLYGICFAQDEGYLKFKTTEQWVIEIEDSLTFTSDQVLQIRSGLYHFVARPQIAYRWPVILIKDQVDIMAGDTTYYKLSKDKSLVQNSPYNFTPRITSYNNRNYQPSSTNYRQMKTGLIVSAIAANWLAFYFKRLADDNYSKYQSASSISTIKTYYDRAGRFDDFSSIMLGISAAALSGYIYMALTE